MKFFANRSTLQEALTITGKAIGNSFLPILSSYLFKIDNDRIEIIGGSMDIFIKSAIKIQPCGFTASIAISKNKLFDLIKESPNQEIEFEVVENKDMQKDRIMISLKVTTSIGEYFIPIEQGDDYPIMKIEDPKEFSISQKNLLIGIESTLFACGNDTLKPEYTGVNIGFTGQNMEFTASDTFVVSSKTVTLDSAVNIKHPFIIPQKVLGILQSFPMDEIIKVLVTDNHIKFSVSDDTCIESILVEAKFPAYKGFIPVKQPNHLSIRKNQFQGSIKRVNRFSDPGNSQLSIDILENEVIVATDNLYGDKAEEKLQLAYVGGYTKIGMSGKLLLTCLSHINTDNVSISFEGEMTPMILRDSDEFLKINTNENFILIMPMRLDGQPQA